MEGGVEVRKPFIAGNWKMNLDRARINGLCEAVRASAAAAPGVEVGLFPPFPYIAMVVEALKGTEIVVGGQDLYFEKQGAYTGQVSAAMLRDVGAVRVLVGHSERRHLFGDTDETVRKKLAAALDAGLDPVLCVGEQLPERKAGRTAEVVLRQVAEGLRGFPEDRLDRLVIAYEPVWAIGTGVHATPEQAGEAHAIIRNWCSESLSETFAERLRILYGGSVTPDNVADLMAVEGVDGALVGGASLKPDSFDRIVRYAS